MIRIGIADKVLLSKLFLQQFYFWLSSLGGGGVTNSSSCPIPSWITNCIWKITYVYFRNSLKPNKTTAPKPRDGQSINKKSHRKEDRRTRLLDEGRRQRQAQQQQLQLQQKQAAAAGGRQNNNHQEKLCNIICRKRKYTKLVTNTKIL